MAGSRICRRPRWKTARPFPEIRVTMDIADAEDTIDRRGEGFVRLTWRRIAVLAILLGLALIAVRLSSDVIRRHRLVAAMADATEQQLAAAEARLADRSELEAETDELRAARADHTRLLLTGDLDAELEALRREVKG